MSRLSMTFGTLLASVALALAGGPADAQVPAGVTAAVNPQATGTPPSLPTRVLEVGGNVVQNEHVATGPEGQAQLLFRDGSTMTLGPDSDLTIDNFVYDPEAKTAKLAMTAAIGVFRFVGGRASKDEPVVINTPTTTIGIRGAAMSFEQDREGTRAHKHYGNYVDVISKSTREHYRLTQNGFTVIVNTNLPIQAVKTDLAELGRLFARLNGRPGANGGGTSPNENSANARKLSSSNSNSVSFSPGSVTITANNLSFLQSLITQLTSQTAQVIATGAAGSGSFPFTLPGYNAAIVSPDAGFSASSFASSGLGAGISDIGFGTTPPFSFNFTSSGSSSSGAYTLNIAYNQSEAAAITFSGGVPNTITDTFSQSAAASCSGPGCSGLGNIQPFSNTATVTGVITNATVSELGGDQFIRFGRLSGATLSLSASGSSFNTSTAHSATYSNQVLPFVVGVPASLLPTSGTFNYSLIGATSPVFVNGIGTPGSFAGSLSIQFVSPTQALNFSNIPGLSYSYPANFPGLLVTLNASVTMPNDGVYPLNGTFSGVGSAIFGSLFFTGPTGGRACSSSCLASISGLLAGPGGSRAGLAYLIGNSGSFGPNSIIGVAAFKR